MSNISRVEVKMAKVSIKDLLHNLQIAIKNDEIKLPSMPEIAIKIRKAFAEEQYDIMHIANIVQTDPGLSAYTLKVANSPLHRGPIPIDTTKHAICRLGQHTVQSIVLAYTVKSMFKTKSSTLKDQLNKQWKQSVGIASIGAILARRCEGFDPDQVLLAGLLQDVGTLPILNWLQDQPVEKEHIEALLDELIQECTVKVGVMLMNAWGFSDEMIEMVKARECWDRNPSSSVDTADIVNMARYHYYIAIGKESTPEISDIAAYHKLPFKELTSEQSLAVLDELGEDIAEIKAMLN